MKLKTNTSLIIIIAAAVLLQVISAVQYYYTRSLLADELELRAESELTTKAVIIKNSLNLSENTLKGHVWDLMRNLASPDSLYDVVEWVLRSHPNLLGCGVAFEPDYFPKKGRLYEPYAWWENGEIKTAQIAGDDHDYTQMAFYKDAIREQEPMWANAYYDRITGKNIVTYGFPIRDKNDSIVAVYALDMSTDMLGDTLNYRHVYPSSYVIMLTNEGGLLAAPDSGSVKRSDVEHVVSIINDSTVEKTLTKDRRCRIATFYDPDDNEKGYVYFTFFKGRPSWQIAVVCYDHEVYGKLSRMKLIIGLLMLAGLVILSLIVLGFAGNDRRLQAVKLEKERIGSELRIARNIQMQMLPETFPPFPERDDIDIYGSLVPAREVGGDIFDFYLRDEKLFLIIGDVSGKGVPSALVMSVVHSLLRMAYTRENNPGHILQSINETICDGNEQNMFVTMFIGVLDLPTGLLRYCNAGHDVPIIISRDGVAEQLPVKANLPVGLFDDFVYRMQETTLERGSLLFLYTDGLTEAKNNQRRQFGIERMMSVLSTSADLNPQQLLEKMTAEVHAFVEGAEQSDDLTMLAIRYSPVTRDLLLDEEMTLQNDVLQVKDLNAFVKQMMNRLNIESSLAKKLQLAVEEAVVNIIDYAYPEGETGDIVVRISSDGQSLKFVIKDCGAAFDPTMKENPDISNMPADRPVGGLGILLVREMMDSINYERTDGMNVLTLKKIIKH